MANPFEESLAEQREALRESAERDEAELRSAMEDLGDVAQTRFDFRSHVAANPWPWMLGSFLLGVWLGRR
jgi:hypothetical protein